MVLLFIPEITSVAAKQIYLVLDFKHPLVPGVGLEQLCAVHMTQSTSNKIIPVIVIICHREGGGWHRAGVKPGRDRVSNLSCATAEECQGPARRNFPCMYVSMCSSCVSTDARRVEGGDGAAAGWHAPRRGSVRVLPQEAGESGRRWSVTS